MEDNFVFKFGKHAGKTYGWLKINAPSYLAWCKENAPNMLKEPKPKPKALSVEKPIEISTKTMSPNLNFSNEGPHELSIPYIKKMKELENDRLNNSD